MSTISEANFSENSWQTSIHESATVAFYAAETVALESLHMFTVAAATYCTVMLAGALVNGPIMGRKLHSIPGFLLGCVITGVAFHVAYHLNKAANSVGSNLTRNLSDRVNKAAAAIKATAIYFSIAVPLCFIIDSMDKYSITVVPKNLDHRLN